MYSSQANLSLLDMFFSFMYLLAWESIWVFFSLILLMSSRTRPILLSMKAKIPQAKSMRRIQKICSYLFTGEMSPYPTVIMVTEEKYKAFMYSSEPRVSVCPIHESMPYLCSWWAMKIQMQPKKCENSSTVMTNSNSSIKYFRAKLDILAMKLEFSLL